MKKMLLLNCFCLLAFYFSPAQQTDYKVVFDLTSKDTLSHQTAIRQMSSIIKTNPEAKLEIVLFDLARVQIFLIFIAIKI